MSVASSRISTTVEIQLVNISGFVSIWTFPSMDAAREVRDEITRLLDRPTSVTAPPG